MKVVELYKIVVDEGATPDSDGFAGVYYWTNSDKEISYLGDTYSPISINRGNMDQSSNMERQSIQLVLAPDNPLAQMLHRDVPDKVLTVTVFRKQNDNVLVYWKGRVAANKSKGWEFVLECESVFTSMRRTGARARYQVQCRHALYGTACGVDKSLYAVAGTVSSVSGTTVDVSSAGGDFIGGMIEFNGIFRFIVGQTGTTIRLWRSMPGLEAADNVTLYPGCNRTLAQCHERFNNAENHGGFPWLPYSNPFQNVNIF